MPIKKRKPAAAKKAASLFPYCKLRRQADGSIRPRFSPSPRERERGFDGVDLKHSDGSWFTLDQVAEFARNKLAEIHAARNARTIRPETPQPAASRTVADLMRAYFTSEDFKALRPKSRRDYLGKGDAILYRPRPRDGGRIDMAAKRVPEMIATMPARLIRPAIVKAFYERLVKQRGPVMAIGVIRVLSIAFSWQVSQLGWEINPRDRNPCSGIKMRKAEPRVVVFTLDEVHALVAAADAAGKYSMGDAIMVALFTGQREGDILALADPPDAGMSLAARAERREQCDLIQSKTGARVILFCDPRLTRRLRAAEERRRARKVVAVAETGPVPVVMSEETGEAWNEHTFRHHFDKLRAKVALTYPAVADKQFRDLRDTAVTWLANANASLYRICSMTGHSAQGATLVLQHYVAMGGELVEGAQKQLEEYIDLLEKKHGKKL